MKNKKIVILLLFVFVFTCSFFVMVQASSSIIYSNHEISSDTELYSSNSCSSLEWITARYTWEKGGIFSKDKCDVFMQTAGISSGQTNEVTATIWNKGQIYSTETKSSAKASVIFNVKGKLWSASNKVEAGYDASYVALGNQHWTVVGD